MTARANLKLVDKAEQPIDITLALRADIQARDWAKMHIDADRRGAVFLPERIKRTWLF